MKKDVMILTGAGQIGMAIARRMGYGKKIVVGDKKPENAGAIAGIMNGAGFDAVPVETDISSRDSVQKKRSLPVHYPQVENGYQENDQPWLRSAHSYLCPCYLSS